jgi:hypothetical protein
MLRDIVQRLFNRPGGAPRPAAAARSGERRAANVLAEATIPAGLGAQRPLVAPNGRLAAFEFHVGDSLMARLRRREDEPTIVAATASLLGAMRLCVGRGLLGVATLPAAWLARAVATPGAIVPGMLLTLQPDECFADADRLAALLQQLRAAGARVGWPADVRVIGPLPDHVVVPRPAVDDLAGWQHVIDATAARWKGVPLLLPELPDVDTLERLLKPPVALAGCVVGTAATRPRSAGVPPQAQRLLQLLNRLVCDHDTALLVADIKADAGLALRLIEHLNTAGAMPGRQLESIDEVVLVLGRSALYRWVAQMLVQSAPPRPAAEALQALALARARLLEALAREAGEANPGGFYLLGLTSALPALLQCPLDDAIAPLNLPAAAVQALRDGNGPWSPALTLALALERHEMGQAEALAVPFGGLPTVMAQATRAWMPGP